MKNPLPIGLRKQQRTAAASKTAVERVSNSKAQACRSFAVVGLGASAGGLEALEQFLGNVPKDSGLGFVVVQHLDPTRKGILVELLQRKTTMPVVQITDRMRMEPDQVYVIPPNKDLSLLHGVLHLLEPAAPRGLRLPIDFFFRSLAADRQEQSVGVILSGMGSDGTLGLRAIKEKAGAGFVQTPASAKFDSMPRAAIDGGLADIVAPADELPAKIISYLQHFPVVVRRDHDITEKDRGSLEKIVILLRAQTGHDFSLYKKNTISRRIERRMGLHQITDTADYVRYLRENSQEADLLFKELLIGVTSFFRDPIVWEQLAEKIIPHFLATRPKGGMLRAWTAACSTGEEAYSLAMILKEVLERTKKTKSISFQIFATDLDKDAIQKARTGTYPANISADVSEKRLDKFFIQNKDGSYTVKSEIRELVIFAPQNLVMQPPFTKLDIVICRNLLIYLEAELQKKLMPLFHYSLRPGGLLILGSSETVGTSTDLFSSLAAKLRIYRRLETPAQAGAIEFPTEFTRSTLNNSIISAAAPISAPIRTLQSQADQLLLQRYSPAAVLVTKAGDILYVSGKTGKYLEPAAGKANWNLFAMAREGLGIALTEAFHKAVRHQIVVTLKNVLIGTKKDLHVTDITVQPMTNPDPLQGMVMVVFTNVTKKPEAQPRKPSKEATTQNSRLGAIAQDLRQAHQDLQATRDEMQTSQEELRSTNEELQSMNEELQSTNEELTTSKEEMQSMNEELQTVNHELQAKVDELSHASDDMKNLLDSTDIATLFLDKTLLVRRFTAPTASIIKLIPSDIGRPITDIVTTLDYPLMVEAAKEVVRKQVFIEKHVSAQGGRWFTVRIMPYRTQENRIAGVVITFTNITKSKKLEAALRKAESESKKRLTNQTIALDRAEKNLLRENIHTRPAKLLRQRSASVPQPKERP